MTSAPFTARERSRGPAVGPGRGPLRRLPGDARLAIMAAGGLAGSWFVAEQTPVPRWELDVVRTLTDVPDAVASALYPVMQLGTVGAPLAAGVAIGWVRRDLASAVATWGVGLAAWFGAKGLKRIVDRDRPIAFLEGLVVREGQGSGLGFPSGHSAVAAATAVMVAAALPRRLRWIPAVLAGTVGVARIVHGVHLPADVVGGWSFGVLLGLFGLAVVDRPTV